MAENGNGNGNGHGSNNYRDFERKLDSVERDFREDTANIRSEMREGNSSLRVEMREQNTAVLDKIERYSKPTSPYQLIAVVVTVFLAFGGAGAYVAKNLNENIVSVNETLSKTINAVDATLASELGVNKKSIETEERERIDSTRRIYDNIGKTGDRAWSRDAQTEFEKRIDEEKGLEREYVRERMSRNEHDIDRVASIVVPREDETQYRTTVTRDMDRLDRTTADTLARITEHLNKSDDHNEAKFAEVERVVHGYGLGDEVKDLQTQVRDAVDKIFRLISPSLIAPPPGPPGN